MKDAEISYMKKSQRAEKKHRLAPLAKAANVVYAVQLTLGLELSKSEPVDKIF